MKVVKCDSKESTTYRRLQNEIAIHMQLDHPNVVKFMGGFDYRSDLYIFTEYCSMGSMEQLLKELEI
jgi:serine/threonine protein kinase